ncbi:autotransporter domain-containing protein [Kaustia mangrovi]|uniref:Autotransporter domain-containing protein n=1 Tax=Kaustia mangrovi TaxID=2593653 RepID=A0A7S8C2N0_9HYPH|nr:autotransporter domain-containing protein [Kaustia mangrovi]QPC42202.1 autotransporter domain-containing protein [Kaustia mangrovi]
MTFSRLLKLTCSTAALAATALTPAAAQNSWTGASSYHATCYSPGGSYYCPQSGDNDWHTGSNWSSGLPTAAQDVNIGLATQQFWSGSPQDRPVSHDSVVISSGKQGNAGNLTIGFSGGRALSGSFGAGQLDNSGTLVVTSDMVVGSTGHGTFGNAGTTTVGGNFIVGGQSKGMAASAGTISVGADTVLGQGSGAEGELAMFGGLDTAGNLVIGGSGDGLLLNGGDVTAGGDTVLGQNAGANGTATLTSGATLQTSGDMTVGHGGEGQLSIAVGAFVGTEGDTTLGTTGSGTVLNEGVMLNRGDLTVGEMGYGYIETSGPAAITTTEGDTALGSAATGTGIAIVSQGTMTNFGRLDVGLRGEGNLIVDQGGRVNNDTGVMAKEPGATAYAVVKGPDSLWNNNKSLTVASESGSAGVLVVNEGATVIVDHGVGQLTIAEHEGSIGILNIGAMSPEGQDYGVNPVVSTYLGGTDTDPTPRAPGIIEAALVQFGEGNGTVNFKHTGNEAFEYRFKPGFAGDGTVNHLAGFTVLDGDSSAFEGAANVSGGTMVVNNVLAGHVTVAPSATLRIGHEGGSRPGDGTTGHVVNDIVNNGLVQFNRSDEYVFSSIVSGTGDVEQIGTGTTVLTGENTYTGSTTIARGTLQLGDGGTTGSIDHTSGVTINTAGTLAFNRSDVKIFDRIIAGTGTIRQIGSGLTRLVADNSGFTGQTFVDRGTLSVNGTLGGTVNVNDGAKLEGLGTVGTTTVHSGATVAPGNSTDPGKTRIGTLSVQGHFTQKAGSVYQAEVLSTGPSDRIDVTGTATIADGTVLKLTKIDEPRYELEHRYTVLTAAGGVTGDYDLTGDTSVSTFYRVEDHYDANNVYLDVTQYRQFQEAGLTVNQINAATAAQELKSQRDPITDYPTNPLFRAIAYLQTDAEARDAFDQISGEIHASAQAGILEDSRFVREATGGRLRDAVHDEGLDLWAHGFGSWGHVEDDGNAARIDRRIGGIFAGIDLPVLDTFRVGILGGYSNAHYDVDDRHSTAKSDDYYLGLYGGGEWNGFGIQIAGNYIWHDVSTARSIAFAGFSDSLSADYWAHTAQVYGDIGYTFELDGMVLEPFGGLAYVHVSSDDYEEKGGAAALSGSADTLSTVYGTLGLRGAVAFRLGDFDMTASGSAGWRHSFKKHLPSASHAFDGSGDFDVYAAEITRDAAIIEAGLDAAVTENLALGVAYSGLFGNDIADQGVQGSVSWKF